MPPHNIIAFNRPRTLANVLLDLKEARREWDQAGADAQTAYHERNLKLEDEAGDRMCETDKRIDELRAEFATMFQFTTGLTWKQVEQAVSEGLL